MTVYEHLREECHTILAILDEINQQGPEGYSFVDPDHSLKERLQHELLAISSLIDTL